MALQPLCPAALPLAGPPTKGPSVLCGVLALDREKEDQIGMKGREEQVVFTSRDDPMTYFGFCCYRYDDCRVYQAERQRLRDQRFTLGSPDPNSVPEAGV